jgi:hypothetical protein
MTVGGSISAFAFRGSRGRAVVERLAYAGGIAILMLLLAAWIVAAERDTPYHDDTPWSVLGLADVFAVWALGLGAFILGPAVVAATVAGERRAGTLDQLRTTPLSPLQLAAGLLIGAPSRLYLLCAGPLAIHLAAGLFGVIPFDTLVSTLVVLVVGGAASAVIGLCVALAPKQETGGAFVALGVAAFLGAAGLIASTMATESGSVRWAFLHPAGALQSAMLSHDGLWRRLFISSWRLERFSDTDFGAWLSVSPALSVVTTLIGGALLLRAACRRLAAPHRPLLSKKQALALFTLGALGIVLPLPLTQYSSETTVTAFATGLMLLPLAATLATLATPTFEAWALALRQGRKLRWSDDDAAPQRAFVFMTLVFLIALKAKLPLRFPSSMGEGELEGFGWALGVALTLPLFALFASTRYSTGPARFGFAAAVFAHVLYQIIVIAAFASNNGLPSSNTIGSIAVEAGMFMAVAVPAWVWFCQRRLAQRVRAGATT